MLPLLSRGELMELDPSDLVEKIIGLRGDIADDAEEMADLRAQRDDAVAQRDAALARADAAEAELARLRAELATLRPLADALRAESVGLRATGARKTPPTEAEAATHNAARGWWLISREGVCPPAAVDAFRGDGDVTAHLPFVGGATWLPLDATGRPCAWPTVRSEGT